jgi:hypothetical protein
MSDVTQRRPQGMELMLRSMGLGEVLDVSQRLANEGTVDAILKFAKGLDQLNENLARLHGRLERIELAVCAGPEPGSSVTDSGDPGGDRKPALEQPRSNGQSRISEPSSRAVNGNGQEYR